MFFRKFKIKLFGNHRIVILHFRIGFSVVVFPFCGNQLTGTVQNRFAFSYSIIGTSPSGFRTVFGVHLVNVVVDQNFGVFYTSTAKNGFHNAYKLINSDVQIIKQHYSKFIVQNKIMYGTNQNKLRLRHFSFINFS